MRTELTGKVAIVTGAARGLGLILVGELLERGMQVVAVDVRSDDLVHAATDLAARHGATVLALQADTSREEQVAAMVARTLRTFGRIDVLVNNAGVRFAAPVWATDSASWDRVHDSNLKGAFLCTREVLAQDLLRRGEGTLVFVSSLAGKRGLEGAAAYSSSKWGVIGFAESVAKDLKHTRIRVTTIAPGRIETPMARESDVWKLGLEWLDPVPVARAIVFAIAQDADTILPELQIHHRAQL